MVISGINAGANLGMDIHRSGTFGAAREALLMGVPAIAISNVDYAESAESMLERLHAPIMRILEQTTSLCGLGHVLNVNIPKGQVAGEKLCHVDSKCFYQLSVDLCGDEPMYAIADAQVEPDKGSDIYWIYQGYVTYSKVSLVPATV